jgi:hypothetical protein
MQESRIAVMQRLLSGERARHVHCMVFRPESIHVPMLRQISASLTSASSARDKWLCWQVEQQATIAGVFNWLTFFGHVRGSELYPSHKHRLPHNISHLVCFGMKLDRGGVALRPYTPSLTTWEIQFRRLANLLRTRIEFSTY